MPARTVLCTFPGKYGDLLWALPTIRALSRRLGQPVDLLLPARFQDIGELLARQPYLDAVVFSTAWVMQDTAPISPRVPPPDVIHYDGEPVAMVHLGYRDWPLPNCLLHTLETCNLQVDASGLNSSAGPITVPELTLDIPWITLPDEAPAPRRTPWVAGFTDEYFELKFGLWTLLSKQWRAEGVSPISISVGGRWQGEAAHPGADWLLGAYCLQHTDVFLGDCSAWHVLAAAMGVPVIVMEPQSMRHNEVFYPLPARQVYLVTGNDGKPTFDSRHVAEALTYAILRRRQR